MNNDLLNPPFPHSLDFSNFDWRMLKAIKFIPVKIARKSTASSSSSSTSSTTTSIEWMEPGRVFFSGASSSVYQDHFHYVDFGPTANTFLRACGVKDEPTPPELAARLVREPQAFLDSSGFEAYMTVLRQLAANFSSLRQQSSLLAEMRREPFLIGLHSDQTFIQEDESEKESSSLATLVSSSTSSVSSSSPPAAKKLKYQLSSASDIYLIDDTILQQIFQPLGCPLETLLEEMYQELGSKWLSKQVKEVYEPRGRGQVTERTTKLQNLIRDRAALLLYDGIVVRSAKELARNAEKTLKNMCVFEVQEISIVREFGKKRDSQKVGACMMLDGRTKQHVVFVAGEPDYFDVAR